MDDAVADAFRFLIDRHGYSHEPTASGLTYRSRALAVATTLSERDGFDTHLLVPARGTAEVAIGTILAALNAPNSHEFRAQAAFLQKHLSKFEHPSTELYRDLVALRFWHAGTWRPEWGKGIKLGKIAIEEEGARLLRLKEYFTEADNVGA